MNRIAASVVCLSLCASGALAGPTSLTAGKPAGVQKAQISGTGTVLIIGGVGLAAAGIAIAASAGNGSGPTSNTSPTTSSTSTTGTTS